ncbi:MAG: hypothetical protein J6V25_05915 [Oscillospiraceae bacterium]|nr:hypothetical protein [Oscillospiraceae bacterium]
MIKSILSFLKKWNSSYTLAVLFLVYIFYMSLSGIPDLLANTADGLRERVLPIGLIDRQYAGMLDTDSHNPLLHNKGTYIEINGTMARLLGQPMVNERHKLRNGYLTILSDRIYTDQELRVFADNIYQLWQHQVSRGKHFLFVMAPTHLLEHENLLPAGFVDNRNHNANRLLAMLDEYGIPYLDIRAAMKQTNRGCSDSFFATDHHWTPQTAFWAYGLIMEKLVQMNAIDPISEDYTDPDRFVFQTYPDSFLGSAGKRTGRSYAGVDDFCLIYPKFETHIQVSVPEEGIYAEGSYLEAAYSSNPQASCSHIDYFNSNPYGLYGWGDQGTTYWRNPSAPDASTCMFIGDSFGNIPFSLMSLCFRSIDELDMRHYQGNFAQHHADLSPDIVIMEISALINFEEQCDYPFFPDETAPK